MSSPPVHVDVSRVREVRHHVREVRNHAGRQQEVIVLHGRGCADIGESGLEPVQHKIGKMICWVRITIIVSSLPRRNVVSAGAA